MSGSRATSPLPPILRLLAPPLAAVYGRIIDSRNRAFDAGRGVVEIDRPVVSVGNLSVGGTGKTPMVAWIVGELLEAGFVPAIAMRGYSKGGGSDEAEEYRARFPRVHVVAQADRLEGLIRHFETPEGARCNCVVLDDGFQHRRIARQLEIVLIDSSRDPFTDRLLPAGWLRESVESLGRADFVVLTHAEAVSEAVLAHMERDVRRVAPQARIALAAHKWVGLTVADRESERAEAVGWLRGKRVLAACGIGNPRPFLDAVKRATGTPPTEFIRPDHDPFVPRTLAELLRVAGEMHADAIVTTEKDWSKLKRVKPEAWPCPVARAQLKMGFLRGDEELREALFEAADSQNTAGEQ